MSAPQLRPISSRGMAAEVAGSIREAILSGVIAPGDTLREGPLAQSLGVSRGSVREGLAILEREGIVQTGWHRPASVVQTTRARAQDLYGLRAGLDRIAAQGAALRARREDFEAALADFDSASGPGARRSDLVRADLAFHDAVYAIAGNEALTDAWRAIRSQVRLYQLLRTSEPERGYDSGLVAEHAKYAEILASGDADAAASYAERHVASALDALLKRLED